MIGHLDADCFYVPAERVRNSFLTGKPVGVLGNQGACVIAKSYETKAAATDAAAVTDDNEVLALRISWLLHRGLLGRRTTRDTNDTSSPEGKRVAAG